MFTVYSLELTGNPCKFLADLAHSDPAEHARLWRRIEFLADRRASRRHDEFNSLGDGLYEAKSSGGGRVIFFYDRNYLVIGAYGFVKKSPKTPGNVLVVARANKKAYEQQRARGMDLEIVLDAGQQDPRRKPL